MLRRIKRGAKRARQLEKSLQGDRFAGRRGRRVDPRVFALVDPWWTLAEAARASAALRVLKSDVEPVRPCPRGRHAMRAMRLVSWNVSGRYGPALQKQVCWLAERRPDVVALQEVRKESVDRWLGGLAEAGLEHAVDSAKLLGSPGPPGRDYRRRYFNLISARRRSFPFWARGAGGSRSRAPGRRFS